MKSHSQCVRNTVPHTSLARVRKAWDHPLLLRCPLSSSGSAKARAAAQANNELHLRSSPACARPRSSSRSSRTLAEASETAVSAENRPPTCPVRTTSWPGLGHPRTLGTAVPFSAVPLSFKLAPLSVTVRGLASLARVSQLQVERFGTDGTHPPPRASWRTG